MANRLSDFLPDSDPLSKVQVVGNGMSSNSGDSYQLVREQDITVMLKPRQDFSHKGTYGHALIIAGERATMGAALLASSGCLYAGAGLISACIPESGLTSLNTALPEVMYQSRDRILQANVFDKYDAVAIGPGIGLEDEAVALLSRVIEQNTPIIADADALNLLSLNSLLMQALPGNSILTPHIKEFDKMFGTHENWFGRLQTARAKALEMGIVIILKNRYSFIIDVDGVVYINPTGSPAMAQGGMGDVLTGIIAAFIAQGYKSKEASILSCYIHGAAGSYLAAEHNNLRASDLAKHIPKIIKLLAVK